MFAFLGPLLLWGQNNMKWVAIIVVVLAAGLGLYKYNRLVSDNALLKYENVQLARSIKEKDATITFERNLRVKIDEAIQEQNQKLDQLSNRFENITVDLGPDSGDQAPDSLKELLRRIRAGEITELTK